MVLLVPRVLLVSPDLQGKMEARVLVECLANKAPLVSLGPQELKESREPWAKKVAEDIQA